MFAFRSLTEVSLKLKPGQKLYSWVPVKKVLNDVFATLVPQKTQIFLKADGSFETFIKIENHT